MPAVQEARIARDIQTLGTLARTWGELYGLNAGRDLQREFVSSQILKTSGVMWDPVAERQGPVRFVVREDSLERDNGAIADYR